MSDTTINKIYEILQKDHPNVVLIENIDEYYVGRSNDVNFPEIISGPFKKSPNLSQGHYLYMKAMGNKWVLCS